MRKNQLSNLTISAFAHDEDVPLTKAQQFFSSLVENGFATPIVKYQCKCGEDIALSLSNTGKCKCPLCNTETTIDVHQAKSYAFKIDKEVFIKPKSTSDISIVQGWLSEPTNSHVKNIQLLSNSEKEQKMEKKAVDLIVITALQEECAPFKNLLHDALDIKLDGYYCTEGKLENPDASKAITVALICIEKMGMVPAAFYTTKALEWYNPKYVAMIGMVASTVSAPEINYGDILIADQAWDYGSGKIEVKGGVQIFEPAPEPILLSSELRQKLLHFRNNSEDFLHRIKKEFKVNGDAPTTELKIHIGPVASGAAVVADDKVAENVKLQQRKVIGIDMEIYGVYYSIENQISLNKNVFAMKSVVDYANEEKSNKYHKYACCTSARVLHQFCLTELFA